LFGIINDYRKTKIGIKRELTKVRKYYKSNENKWLEKP